MSSANDEIGLGTPRENTILAIADVFYHGLARLLILIALFFGLIFAAVVGFDFVIAYKENATLQRKKLKMEVMKLRVEMKEKGIDANEVIDGYGYWKRTEKIEE